MSQSETNGVTASKHTGGVVLFQAATGRLFLSNETGARIWQGLTQRFTLDDIAEEISREYRIEYTRAREHAAQFVAELERQSLIEARSDR